MATDNRRISPAQIAQAKNDPKIQAKQAEWAKQANPQNLPLPGPGFFMGPIYITDDGQKFLTPGGMPDASGGQFRASERFGWDDVAQIAGIVGGGLAAGAAGGIGFGGGAAGAAGSTGGAAAAAAGSGIGSTLLGALPAIGQGANALLQGRTAGRVGEAEFGQSYDRLALERARLEDSRGRGMIDDDLAQRRYLDDNYQRNARNAVGGGFLMGAQDVNIGSPGTIPRSNISGGLRPSAITGAREIGQNIQRDALTELTNPTQAPGGRGLPSYRPGPLPELSQPPAPSGVDTALNWTSILAPIANHFFRRNVPGGTTQPLPPSPVLRAGQRSAFR